MMYAYVKETQKFDFRFNQALKLYKTTFLLIKMVTSHLHHFEALNTQPNKMAYGGQYPSVFNEIPLDVPMHVTDITLAMSSLYCEFASV